MSDNAIVIGIEHIPQEVHGKLAEFQALLEAVDKDNPDPQHVAELRRWFEEFPGLWAVYGDLNAFVQQKIMDRLAGTKSGSLAMEKGVSLMREDLGHALAPPLEKLLIEHTLVCWLRLQDTEWRYTLTIVGESTTFKNASYWERRLSAAQRRYLRACETLARVRKITRQTPALQVNIATRGGQQVNILGDVKGGKEE